MNINPLQGIYLPPTTDQGSYPLPFYLSPPTGPYTELGSTIEMLREDIFRLAGQQGVTGVQKQSSGIAKAFDFQAQEYVLKDSAKMAGLVEETIARFFQLYVKSEIYDYDVMYEVDYGLEYPISNIQMYGDYIALNPGQKGSCLAKEQLTRLIFSDLDDEEVQPVIDEIRAEADKSAEAPLTAEAVAQAMMTQADPAAQSIAKAAQPLDNATQKSVNKNIPSKKFSIKKFFGSNK